MKSKQTNYLLLKDGIGKPRPFTRDLPEERFTYGKPLIYDPEGAGDCNSNQYMIVVISDLEMEIP